MTHQYDRMTGDNLTNYCAALLIGIWSDITYLHSARNISGLSQADMQSQIPN